MAPFRAFCGKKCTPYLEVRVEACSGAIGFNKHNIGPFSHIVTTFSIQGHPSKITIVTPCLTLFLNLLKTIFKMYIARLKAISRKGS